MASLIANAVQKSDNCVQDVSISHAFWKEPFRGCRSCCLTNQVSISNLSKQAGLLNGGVRLAEEGSCLIATSLLHRPFDL